MTIRVTKVKLAKEGKLNIKYQQMAKNGNWDDVEMTCSDAPAPSLPASLDALAPFVISMLELPATELDRIRVKGISVSYCQDTDIMGTTIVAIRLLNNSNTDMNLNTPHKFETYPSGQDTGDENQLLDGDCVDAIKQVFYEVEQYLDGNRAQLSLFETLPTITEERASVERIAEDDCITFEHGGQTITMTMDKLGKAANLITQMGGMPTAQLRIAAGEAMLSGKSEFASIIGSVIDARERLAA